MATLFDSASLVMIPSGVKEDKLYSIKPTDGSGDFTFSRGSDIQATRVNSSGLIEKAKVNLLLQSNSFGTTWSANNTSVTGGQSGYDGSSDAWLLENASANGSVRQTISATGVQTYSFYAKKGTTDWVAAYVQTSGSIPYCFFDLTNGVKGATQNNVVDSSITDVGGGWYRIALAFNNTTTDVRIFPAEANAVLASQVGDNIYIQDAQLNYGLVAQDYVNTTTDEIVDPSDPKRDALARVEGLTADLPRLDYSGGASCPSLLLEPSRTNLVTSSEWLEGSFSLVLSLTASLENVTAPDGSNLVTKLQANSDAGGRAIEELGTLGTNHIWSGFFKGTGTATRLRFRNNQGSEVQFDVDASGNFTLHFEDAVNDNYDIEDYGNGWYRIWFETTTSGVTSNYVQIYPDIVDGDGSVYAWGIQAEAGSYPTSYIPTYGTAANRGGDFNGNTDTISDDSLLAFNSGDDFTLFYEGSFKDVSSTSNMLMGGGKQSFGANYQSYFWVVNGGEIRLSGTSEAVMGKTFSFSIVDDTRYKILAKRSGSTISFFVNGVKGTTTSQTNPDAEFVLRSIGWSYSNGNYNVAGDMNQALVFPTALTDAECISLTTI